MEKISGSAFGRFEGKQIANLSAIKGGDEINTSNGAGQDAGGNFTFTSDSLNTVTGNCTYCGKKYHEE